MRILAIFSLMLAYLVSVMKSDVYTAVSKLKRSVHLEASLLHLLESYVSSSEATGEPVDPDVKRFFYRTKEENLLISAKDSYLENPIDGFHFLRRVVDGWTQLLNNLSRSDCPITRQAQEFIHEAVRIMNATSGWPSDTDVIQAAFGLVRVCSCYNLDLMKLYQGEISNTQTDPLTPREVMYIARLLDDSGQHYDQITWLTTLLSLIRARNPSGLGEVAEVKVYRRLAEAYYKYGILSKSLDLMEEYLQKDPSHKGARRDLGFYRTIASQQSKKAAEPALKSDGDELKQKYERLCRADMPRETSSLKCFHRRTKIPYAVVKEEVICDDPRVLLFHDIIHDGEIRHVRQLAFNKLERSRVVLGDENNYISKWQFRISESSWLWDDDSVVQKLSDRVQSISGLSTHIPKSTFDIGDAEPLQVLNYGIGGMYELHWDYFENDMNLPGDPHFAKSRNRLATWLYYLSDVKLGGATVFPALNIRIPVIKGSAAFWYNVKRSGDVDVRTRHAGCPVVLGSKWVANKWIREVGQVFRRRCGLKPSSKEDEA